MNITHRVQIKFNQALEKYQPFLTLPEYKFFRQMSYGILTNRHIHINKIGSVLQEDISLKKTSERLSRNLGKPNLAEKLKAAHLRVNRRVARMCDYLIFDISDISKEYAQAMEGLARVHDGSKDEIANGYWLAKVIAVNKTADRIIPLYSELYSLEHRDEQDSSENKKILNAVHTVGSELLKSQVVVIDRGGDRRVLIEDFLDEKQRFIIRQTGKRDLHTGKRRISLRSLSQKIKRRYLITITKRRHGKVLKKTFCCGARKVYFPYEKGEGYFDTPLWFVVVKAKGKSPVWFLCYIEADTEEEAIRICTEGYGLRWKIEEVIRQTKSDYHLEKICLRRYIALKNFMVLFWVVMSLIYYHFELISLEILTGAGIKLTYREKLREYIGFIYYKMARAIAWLLSKSKLVTSVKFPAYPPVRQLIFGFQ